MKNRLFQSISVRKPQTNTFDLSHEKKLSCNMGELIPIYSEHVIPSDHIKVRTEIMMRVAPLVAPMMHRVNVTTHYFFVPYRLLWDEWKDFITGGPDGTANPVFPKITIENDKYNWYKSGTVADFLGVPAPPDTGTMQPEISALPFRAYNLIYNEYYRDQNLEQPIDIKTTSTVTPEETVLLTQMRFRAWEKDYFTSSLPWSQRGGEVGIPVDFNYKTQSDVIDSNTDIGALAGELKSVSGKLQYGAGTDPARVENLEEEGVSVTINQLRKASRLQEWLEKNARGGSRYVEQILSHFGVVSSDARQQRPEYLGGGRQKLQISEVLQTGATVVDGGEPHANIPPSPQGNMAGHGISVGQTNAFSRKFEEHGIILGIMSILPRTAYQQGMPKDLVKFDKFDYFFPSFANLGEQEVLNQELYYDYNDNGITNAQTFGYQSRYADYKFRNSSVHGDFKTNLSFWHMGRIFDAQPNLNDDFVKANDVTSRVFAVDDAETENIDKLYVQLYNDVKAIRPMPIFGTPTL